MYNSLPYWEGVIFFFAFFQIIFKKVLTLYAK